MSASVAGAPTAGRAIRILLVAALLLAATPRAHGAAPEVDRNAFYGLRASTVQALELAVTPDGAVRAVVTLDGTPRRLDLEPHSVRGPGWAVLASGPDGVLRPIATDAPRTLRGTITDRPGVVVAAALLDDGLHATVIEADGTRHWIQPLPAPLTGPTAGAHIIYRDRDVLAGAARCAAPDQVLADRVKPRAASPAPGPGEPCVAELACDADHEYFLHFGSVPATHERVEAIVNVVNAHYEAQVGLRHELSTVVVRSTPDDPYTAPDSNTLLCQFIGEWTGAQAGVPRDLAILLTGRNLTGPIVGQAADIGNVCNAAGCCGCGTFGTDGSYCLVQAEYAGSLACAADLTAHELGHLWGESHCDCPDDTMNPVIPCVGAFGPATVADILAYRDTVPCLDGCTAAVPANDACAAAIPVGDGTTSFSTSGATTDGPDEPALCTNAGDATVAADVWFSYLATCSGTVTVDLCGSGFDTKIAVYENCPAEPDAAIACNDDFDCDGDGDLVDDGFVSRVSFPATIGVGYLLRVGGYLGATGTGTMTIACSGSPGADADHCDGAKQVPANAVLLIDNAGATPAQQDGGPGDPELPAGSPSCQWNGTPTDTHATLWFAFVATHETIAIETCAGTAAFDSILALYAGECGELGEIACGEDECGPSGYRSRLCASGLVPGATYRVMVGCPGSWSGSIPGPMTLGLVSPCPDLGGCCLSDERCVTLDAVSCAAADGTWEGGGTTCASAPCPGTATCPADLNDDGSVGFGDLNALLAAWGPCPACPADLGGDGTVGFGDLNTLLAAWGPCDG